MAGQRRTKKSSLEAEIRAEVSEGRAFSTGFFFVCEEVEGEPKIKGVNAGKSHELDAVPSVSAEFVRELLLGQGNEPVGLPQGLRLSGLRITGTLNLDCASAPNGGCLPALALKNCYFDRPVSATHLEIELFDLWGSILPSLDASFIRVNGAFGLYDAVFTALEPKMDLCWADIAGPVGLSNMRTMRADAPLMVRIFQSRIGGNFAMETEYGDQRPAIILLEIFDSHFESSFKCLSTSFGFINARNVKAEAGLELEATRFISADSLSDPKRYSLNLSGAEIRGDISLDVASFEDGALGISMVGTHVTGTLLLRNALVHGGIALMGARLERGWESDGTTFHGARNASARGWAIAAREAELGGSFFLRRSSMCNGHVRLRRMRIEGDLDLSDAVFDINSDTDDPGNEGRWSLDASAIQVAGSVLLGVQSKAGAHFVNGARFDQARIGCDLELSGAVMQRDDGTVAFSFRDATVGGRLSIDGWGEAAATGLIDLTGSSVGVLDDNNGCGWRLSGFASQPPVKLRLNGFRYDRLHDEGVLATLSPGRKLWLDQQVIDPSDQRAFFPQPYDQLIATLMTEGRENDARAIAIQKRIARRKFGESSWVERIINFIYQHTFGYGCSPTRAVLTMVIYWGIGVGGLAVADWHSMVSPALGAEVKDCTKVSAPLYALQLLVPLPNLTAATCTIDQAYAFAKAAEVLYALIGAVLLALAVLTLSGVTRNELNR